MFLRSSFIRLLKAGRDAHLGHENTDDRLNDICEKPSLEDLNYALDPIVEQFKQLYAGESNSAYMRHAHVALGVVM